jgi:hypothetical protein
MHTLASLILNRLNLRLQRVNISGRHTDDIFVKENFLAFKSGI